MSETCRECDVEVAGGNARAAVSCEKELAVFKDKLVTPVNAFSTSEALKEPEGGNEYTSPENSPAKCAELENPTCDELAGWRVR